MSLPRKCFCQHIRHHLFSWTIPKAYFATLQPLSNEMMLNVNVLRARVVCGILCKCYTSLIITHYRSCTFLHKSHIRQQLPQPYRLLCTMACSHVLRLRGGQGNG